MYCSSLFFLDMAGHCRDRKDRKIEVPKKVQVIAQTQVHPVAYGERIPSACTAPPIILRVQCAGCSRMYQVHFAVATFSDVVHLFPRFIVHLCSVYACAWSPLPDTGPHTYIYAYMHARIHLCIHAYGHTYSTGTRAYMHMCIRAYVHTCTYAYIYRYFLKCIHTRIYTHM